jgi:hypothetical protein
MAWLSGDLWGRGKGVRIHSLEVAEKEVVWLMRAEARIIGKR